MGLSQSLYTGWTGLSAHQRGMDNLGNNLANVNTIGYRKTDYSFSNLLSQSIGGSYPGTGDRSASMSNKTGLGVGTGSILHNFSQGPSESTGDPLHCYINGNGFFLAQSGSGMAMTRKGDFYLDHTNNPNERLLCLGDGLPVQGWMAQNGQVTPSQTVGNIYLPAIGDRLAGQITSSVSLRGILPTNTTTSDFNGNPTTNLELKGNLTGEGNSITTHIFAPVTQTDGTSTAIRDEMQEIKVQIDFQGPTLSEDGTTSDWTWTMTTVDWPNPGDPGIQIYPTAEDPSFNQGTISFHNQASTTQGWGAGEAVADKVTPGSTRVRSTQEDEEGNTVTTFFNIPADFALNVSKMTGLDSTPSEGGLETWYVNGNPKGTMPRTITVFDEYTDFEAVEDSAGNTIMQPVRKVEARENTIYFSRSEATNEGSTWSWRSSLDDATGELKFDTSGDLVSSTQSGGPIDYNFSGVRSINSEGAMQIVDQDGFRDGELEEITIDANGRIWGNYSNHQADLLAQLAMGTVSNVNGLVGSSGTLFYPGSASGGLIIGVPGDSKTDFGMPRIGAGELSTGALEGSNVDLSQEFTNMIQLERGYQFNSRVVSTANELLQTALQMKQ